MLLAILAAWSVRRKRIKREQDEAIARSSPLADPRLLGLGLQVVQAVGIRRLLPIFALGAVAFVLGSSAMRARAKTREG